MVAILEKSDDAEGFEQIIDFLSGSYINHALTVNPHVYISCIKQFWNTAVVKRSGVICLPNEEIFDDLARMGYEKPSTKLTFYKAFFSTQWKFFIHTILHSLSAKRTSWNEFSSAMASAVICLSSGQRFNFSNYIFENLVRLIVALSSTCLGKVSRGVETPLFESMLVVRDVAKEAEAQVPAQKLEKINKVKSSRLKWLKKVGTSQSVESSDDMENVFNQGRIIADMGQDEGIELVIPAVKPTPIPSAKPTPIPAAKHKILNITAAPASREEMEEEDQEIIKSINETHAQKAAKRKKLSEEAQEAGDLRKRLEIVQDKDDDVFVEATPLAQKVPVVDYQIVVIDNKPSESKDCQSNIDAARLKLKLFKNITAAEDITK
uniref:Synaptobrevin, longin-like domain protein n=1 Tax=Tanacetum cinerariifolium TaxID=118510 RepID=A0A6L2LD54_TANCI|nr:hypothetical protein [Tanacetum cinerariifolium]